MEKWAENLQSLFLAMVKEDASDLFVKVGAPPTIRVAKKIKPLATEPVTPEIAKKLFCETTTERTRKMFEQDGEADTSYEVFGVGRFRVNIFKQRNNLSFVFRHVKDKIPTLEKLNLPVKQIHKLAQAERGLILVTGTAGSGKSTTIASMIDYVNLNYRKHIITVEDPIEYVFADKQSIIDQRELGVDTQTFALALKHCVRQSPDIIMIGEMRDTETVEAAVNAAETGHLVISTLHTVNAYQTIERIINFFPPHQHKLLQEQLSLLLTGVVCLRLVPAKSEKGLVPAVELMVNTPTVKELLYKGQTRELYKAIQEGGYYGNQTFNQSLKELCLNEIVTLEEAMKASDLPEELKLELRGIMHQAKPEDFNYKL